MVRFSEISGCDIDGSYDRAQTFVMKLCEEEGFEYIFSGNSIYLIDNVTGQLLELSVLCKKGGDFSLRVNSQEVTNLEYIKSKYNRFNIDYSLVKGI